MDNKAKIERLKAIKEELASVQAQHTRIVKLEEAANPMNLSTLLENDLEQAELILAAQDVMARLQEMAEDLAKTSARDLFPLSDRMKAAFGPESAKDFENVSTDALNSAMEAVRGAKDQLGTAILRIEGKLPQNDMAHDAPADMTAADPAMDAPVNDMSGDAFAGADAASGPLEEPLGRARKESAEPKGKPLTEDTVDYRAAGRALLERDGMASLLGWILTEASAAMPASDFGAFAKKITIKANEDPEATAGWIGKKRYGAAAMAQLSAPTMTASSDLGLCESTDLEERAHFDDEDADDGRDGKRKAKGRDQELDKARMRKQMAEGIAKVIESNIATEGKGNAASVVAAFADRFGNLMEGEGEGITVHSLLDMFVEAYGMKPAAYSVMKLKEFMASTDEKSAGAALAAVADTMSKDKNAANKPLSSALSGLGSQERSAVGKVVSKLKADGKNPQKLSDLVDGASEMADPKDMQEEAKPASRFARKA